MTKQSAGVAGQPHSVSVPEQRRKSTTDQLDPKVPNVRHPRRARRHLT